MANGDYQDKLARYGHEGLAKIKREAYRRVQLARFRELGLEPLDVNDQQSKLECQTCMRLSPRDCGHIYRHHDGCPMKEVALAAALSHQPCPSAAA